MINEEQLGNGELRILNTFLEYEKKRLSKLVVGVDDINLIEKINNNIELYKSKISKLENNA